MGFATPPPRSFPRSRLALSGSFASRQQTLHSQTQSKTDNNKDDLLVDLRAQVKHFILVFSGWTKTDRERFLSLPLLFLAIHFGDDAAERTAVTDTLGPYPVRFTEGSTSRHTATDRHQQGTPFQKKCRILA